MNDRENNPGSHKVLYLFLGFLILFILTFSLGVIVGKGLGGHETRIVSEESPLKTPRKEVKEPETTDLSVEQVETPETKGKKVSLPSPTSTPKEAAKIEEETSFLPPTEEPIKVEPKKEEAKKEELLAKQTPAPLEQVEEKVKPDIAVIKEEQTPTPSSTEKPTRVETKKEEATKKNVVTMPQIEPGGKYTVQIGAFQKEEEAREIAESLKSKGYPAFVKTAEIPGKGIWHKVRIGTFKTREEAKLYGDRLKDGEPSIKSVFITVND